MSDCLFCKIVDKSIPAKIVLESDEWLAFEDIDAKAPVHILLIPKQHIADLHSVNTSGLFESLMKGVSKVITHFNLQENGYRVVTNQGKDGGQAVFHLHFHIFGKRKMSWPPG